MATPKHTDIDLSMLTDEERAGLEDTDLVDEGLEDDALNPDDGNGTDADNGAGGEKLAETNADDVNGDGTAKEDADAAAEAAAAEAAAAAAAAEKPAPLSDDVTNPAPAAPENKVVQPAPETARAWHFPKDAADKIASLEEEKDRLAELWDDGELTGKEHREKVKAIEAELEPLKEQRLFAKVSLNTALDTYKTATVPQFLNEHPEYKTGVLRTMIDQEIRSLQSTSADPFSASILAQAHENIRSQVNKAYGVETKAPAPKPAAPAAPKREIPPTLGGLPAADGTETDDGGEFSYLDRLANQNVEEYENALAKLSDEKRDRYLSQ